MATGPGYLDENGIYQFGESDTETLMSDLLNRGMESVSQQFDADRLRLDNLEDAPPYPIHAEYTFSQSIGNGAQGSPTPSLVVARSSADHEEYFGARAAGSVALLKPGKYIATLTAMLGTLATGRSFGFITLGGTQSRSSTTVEDRLSTNAQGLSGTGALTFGVFQTTGATRTVTGTLAIDYFGPL